MTRGGIILRVTALVLAVIAFIVFATQVGLPNISELRGYFHGLGWIALPGFIVFYAAATLIPLPKSLCTIAGGAIFGFWAGLILVLIGATAGSTVAFLGARWLGRRYVHQLARERVRRLDEQIGRRGFITVLVARLVPIVPFTTVNYLFGLTAVTLRSYVGGTAIGIVPGTTVYVAVGAYGRSPGAWPFATAVVGIVVLSIIGIFHTRRVRAAEAATPGASDGAPPATS